MADQSLFQGSQQSQTLLAHRREIAADTAEGHCTSRGAETAGDLLLHLHHAQIALREAIVERHGEAVQEQQHGLLVRGQAIEQITSRRLLASPLLAGLWCRIRQVGLIALGQQSCIASFPVGHLQRMQEASTLGSCLRDGGFHIQQQLVHLSGPGLLLLFVQEGQLPQMMHVTERMLASILPMLDLSIYDRTSRESREFAALSIFPFRCAPVSFRRESGNSLTCSRSPSVVEQKGRYAQGRINWRGPVSKFTWLRQN